MLRRVVIMDGNYVNYTLFRWWFCSWNITFIQEKFEALETGCFVEILVYNFSVLFSFISLKGIFSGLNLWTL